MKKYLLFTFYFLLSTFYVNSQVVFNNAYDAFGSNGCNMRNIIISSDSYMSLGGALNLNGTSVDIVVSYNNFAGSLDSIRRYGEDTLEWYAGYENSLKITQAGSYILGGNKAKNWYRTNMLMKLNNNLDTIFTKTYYPVNDNGNKDVIINNSCVGKDSSYLLIGTTNINNNYDSLSNYQMQLLKTDTLGNLLWRKTYGDETYTYEGYKIVNSFDGGYVLGGWCNKNGGDWSIVKVDENGENPIFMNFGHISYDDGRVGGITALSDSTYIITGVKNVDYENNRARVLKLDRNLNIVWDSLYGKATHSTGFMKCIEQDNNDLVFLGNYKSSYPRYIGTITKMDSIGNILWQKETGYLDTVQTENVTMDMTETPDGGYVFTGWVFNSSTLTPPQQMWLVKTDSLGCDGTEFTCDITNLEQTTQKQNNGLVVYPNPVKNELFVSYTRHYQQSEVIPAKQEHIATATPRKDVNISRNYEKSNDVAISSLNKQMTLTKEQFSDLTIQEKLEYSSKNPNNKLWGEKEKEEMRDLQRKYAYMLPFEVINGKQNIFSIDPMFAMQVKESLTLTLSEGDGTGAVQNTKSIAQNNSSNKFPLEKSLSRKSGGYRDIDITIYNIYGQVVKQLSAFIASDSEAISINVSNLQNGVYFMKVGEEVAKFIKE